jgi:uncharacterized protein
MTMEPEKLSVSINERESVTALHYEASRRDRARLTVLLGHGAGANQMSSFMRMFASGLATRGFDAMTFNFLYTEQGRRLPDPKARLEACYLAVIEAALKHKKLKDNRLVIGGKSMGGRIASQVAASLPDLKAQEPKQKSIAIEIAGLVFLGYPLHPPGKPDQLRAEHLQHISAPMLFVQGSRDAFGKPEEIRPLVKKLDLPATLYAVEGGDHSFKVPKSSVVPQPQVYEAILDGVSAWLRSR